MATIRAAWKRTVRVKEYESETLELMVERDLSDTVLSQGEVIAVAVTLDRDLALAGDALVAERLQARVEGTQGAVDRTPPARPRPSVQLLAPKPQAPDDPDPLV